MKVLLCLMALSGLVCTFEELDWSQIKSEIAYIEPLPNVTYSRLRGRIIGGTEVTRNSAPYQVALIINGAIFCGGSVISNEWVLTAAHCTIRASFVQIRYGAHNVLENEPSQVLVTSTDIINHANYFETTLANDVALVRSPSVINFNNHIQPISLAPDSAGSFAGLEGRLTGWGRTSDSSNSISPVLRQVSVSVLTNAVCSQIYGSSIIVSSTVCTSGAGNVGACSGDSGGPLIADGVQVGVASFVSSQGCERNLPTGFARVSSFRSWISTNAGV